MTLDVALEEITALAVNSGYGDLPTVQMAIATLRGACVELKARRKCAAGDHTFVPTQTGASCFHCSAKKPSAGGSGTGKGSP